jgi:hypothetical protein
MYQELKTIFFSLDKLEQVIFCFWLFCVIAFCVTYVTTWVYIIKHYLTRKPKPSKF